jgi:hypothetical protein
VGPARVTGSVGECLVVVCVPTTTRAQQA